MTIIIKHALKAQHYLILLTVNIVLGLVFLIKKVYHHQQLPDDGESVFCII